MSTLWQVACFVLSCIQLHCFAAISVILIVWYDIVALCVEKQKSRQLMVHCNIYKVCNNRKVRNKNEAEEWILYYFDFD